MKELEEAEDFINLGIVVDKKRKVLMIKRKEEETGKDGSVLKWAFPGGKQRFDETREDCVRREVLAETGYEIRPIKQISLQKHPQFPVMIVYHLCELVSPNPVAKPSEPHEVAEIKWVDTSQIKNLITTTLNPEVAKELKL
jgi:ADP-ribose pyrophosphatase YjhB (NUDIX family)